MNLLRNNRGRIRCYESEWWRDCGEWAVKWVRTYRDDHEWTPMCRAHATDHGAIPDGGGT